ncbi:4-oxalocrotonate decarboxylase [Sphingobium indicum]|uniref:4-oxalocrotonate decarboxylase n=2 Tax=Sphingobium indicum TaxID=332055 RepID=A0A1L5BNN2_SPHIB|nr:fumarylacetoacetate hydrolase family protein [Sphingobium indicum]APL94505.1 4-oxalocrotonate decarboxylase [Sphingobium indicum B90A]NYI23369.1 2-oxo-3-hexenedioate decarboxylase [Sphingobium indicum]RYM04250.1 4-oxalocrotonate decarboxylase [Sphingobium indicum]
MLDAAAIAELADRVDGAQSNRRTIAKLTDDYPGMTVDDGYAVQDECLRRWQARGRALIGYKAGLTSRAKMIQMGVDVPSFGLLMRDTCDAEGGAVPTAGLIHPRVEGEIAYVMARDLSGPDVSIDQVHAATDFIQPAIEILDSRFEKFRFDLPSVVADNGSSARFVMGGRMRRPGDVDPATIGIVLEINGEAAALACSGAVLGHPARAVQMLVAWLHERGRILPAGSVVLTGAATEAMPIDKGDIVCARFQEMGSINVRID